MLSRVIASYSSVALLLAIAIGCSESDGSDTASSTSAASTQASGIPIHVIAEGDYAPYFQSLGDLTRVYPYVIVGKVAEVLLPYDPAGSAGDAAVAGEHVTTAFSVWGVEVVENVAGDDVAPGDLLGVLQAGGLYKGEAYVVDGDSPLALGETYLFFLQQYQGLKDIGVEESWGKTYSSPPYGRLTVSAEGTLSLRNLEWLCEICQAPRALVGQTVEEAQVRISAALEGKLGNVSLAPAVTPVASPPIDDALPDVEYDSNGNPTIVPKADEAARPSPTSSVLPTAKATELPTVDAQQSQVGR